VSPTRSAPLLVALALVLSGCTIGLPGQATGVGETGATLRGEVLSTAAGEVDYWFDYGDTTDYGESTPRRTTTVSGQDTYRVAEAITGLTAGTQYHFQLCVQHHTENPDEVVCVPDRTFTTDAGPATELAIDAAPNLYPEFSTGVHDYVARCDDDPVEVDVEAPAATQVAVAGRPPRSGSFSEDVPLLVGQSFEIAVTGAGAATYHVRCLPTDFPTWTFDRSGQPTQEWTLLGLSRGAARFVTFVDANGTPVWWFRHIRTPLDAKLLADDTVAFARGEATPFGGDDTAYEIRSLDGTLLRTLVTVNAPTDHHDLLALPNGNYLLMTYKPRDDVDLSEFGLPADATVLDAEVQEITPTGALVWTWNSKDHIALDETESWWPVVRNQPNRLPDGRTAYDIVHINGFELDGDGLLLSMRHTDGVYRIRRSDGQVLWKLGGTTTPESLTVVGDPPATTLSGQHDVRRLADGSVTIYDNGTRASRPPRAIRFAIDAAAGTATRLEAVGDSEITSSPCCGSSRKLGSGGWLIGWGNLVSPVIGEYAANGSRVFKLQYPNAFSYRAVPVPPGRVSAAELRQAMDAMAPN
jgi:Arylsulfotransferase (ASST)